MAKKARASCGRNGREPMARQAIDARTAGDVCQRRGNHARNAIGPPAVDGDEGNQQQMRQWQPHRPSCLSPGRCESKTRRAMCKMRHGIAIVQHRAVLPAPDHRCERERQRRRPAPTSNSLLAIGREWTAQSRWVSSRKSVKRSSISSRVSSCSAPCRSAPRQTSPSRSHRTWRDERRRA